MNQLSQWLCLVFGLFITTCTTATSFNVENGYVREVIPGNTITSAYMTLNNELDHERLLVNVTSNVSPRVEIHEHLMEDGMMKMRQLPSLSIAGKDSVTLQPMGYHLMMFDLQQPVKSGDTVEMTLYFNDKSSIEITLPVQSIKQKQKQHHH